MSISTITPPQTPRPKPRFVFAEKSSIIDTYESFAKEGFADLITNQAEFPYYFERRFLSKVDLSKGPILVSVTSLVRTMAIDPDSPKRERKEYLYYTCEWSAKDRLGNEINSNIHTEGKYTKQTKIIKTKLNPTTNEEESYYERDVPKEAYTIPWDKDGKKRANELLTSEKIFGEDSVNITNLAEVQYVVKFPNGNPSRTGFGMQDFLDLEYGKLQKLSQSVKSPYLPDLQRRQNPYS